LPSSDPFSLRRVSFSANVTVDFPLLGTVAGHILNIPGWDTASALIPFTIGTVSHPQGGHDDCQSAAAEPRGGSASVTHCSLGGGAGRRSSRFGVPFLMKGARQTSHHQKAFSKGEMTWRSKQRTRFAFGTIATPRKRRGFMPRSFPIQPLGRYTAHQEIFHPE